MYITKLFLFLFCVIIVHAKSRSRKKNTRIIEGEVADQRDYPFVVSIVYNGHHVCGASILSNRYVLTAAHCTYSSGKQPRDLYYTEISVGSSRWETGTRYKLSKRYAHNDYSDITTTNDIGLFKTQKKIEFTSSVQPVKLYKKDLPKDEGLECMVIGWGYTSSGGYMVKEASDVLNIVKIKTISTEECQRYYRNIDERNICLTGPSRKGTCSGDSGGPLLIYSGGDLMQIGLVSYGGDCNNTAPEVHTRVPYFKDWITKSMKLLDSDNDDRYAISQDDDDDDDDSCGHDRDHDNDHDHDHDHDDDRDYDHDHNHDDDHSIFHFFFPFHKRNDQDMAVDPTYSKRSLMGGRKVNDMVSWRRHRKSMGY